MNKEIKKTNRLRRSVIFLSIAAVLMFGFAYLMVPFYNAMCKVLGINGKPNLTPAAISKDLDPKRMLTMQFVTTTNENLPSWQFYAKTQSLNFHPGENEMVLFYVKNDTDHETTVQAIPSVTPGLAAQYVKKTECFCFTQQTLKAHEARIMPLMFHIDKSIPDNINTLTLSYTLFAANKKL